MVKVKGGHLNPVDSRNFRQRRFAIAPLAEERIMAWHEVCSHRGRECCGGWRRPEYDGDIAVFGAQPHGGLVEVRVIKRGHVAVILRGADARRYDEAT